MVTGGGSLAFEYCTVDKMEFFTFICWKSGLFCEKSGNKFVTAALFAL